MLTMLLVGLWHGAKWTFVVWGGAHGVLLALGRLGSHAELRFSIYKAFGWVVTFLSVMLLWVPFRAESWGEMLLIFKRIFVYDGAPIGAVPEKTVLLRAGLAVGILGAIELVSSSHRICCHVKQSPLFAAVAVSFLLMGISLLGTFSEKAFIYFQF
jgi:alginate O-acetyltransferase complex protein AlgI